MGEWMDGYLAKLEASRQENLAGGGPDRIELQHSLGKLTARERIEQLADPGTFEELGSVVREFRAFPDTGTKPSPLTCESMFSMVWTDTICRSSLRPSSRRSAIRRSAALIANPFVAALLFITR